MCYLRILAPPEYNYNNKTDRKLVWKVWKESWIPQQQWHYNLQKEDAPFTTKKINGLREKTLTGHN